MLPLLPLSLLFLIVALSALKTSLASPSFFIGAHSTSCTDHPQRGYSRHGTPVIDTGIAFTVNNAQGQPQTSVCPGQSYGVQVSLAGGNSQLLLTSSLGHFSGLASSQPNDQCLNRFTNEMGTQSVALSLTLPCTASGPVELRVTAAFGSSRNYRRNTLTLPLGSACSSCQVLPSPPPLPQSPPPVPSVQPPPTPPAPPKGPTLPGCQDSPLGYACAQPLNAGGVILHFTVGGPAPPPNLCTGPGSLVAGSRALPGAGSGAALVHWALEAPVQGYVALGWAAKAGIMVPMDTVIGGVGGNGEPYLATYRLNTYAISPANVDNWALAGGAARTPLGKTVICFSTAATGPAASGRRLQQLLEAGLTAPPTTTLQMNYAVHTSNSLLYHVESGSFALNPATGSLQETRSPHLRRYIVAHASLMLLAFVFLMPTGVLLARHRSLYINKTLGGKGLWFYAHVACQLLAVACFIAGVTIALVVFDSGVPSNVQRIGESHEVIGIILIAMVAVQVVLAVAARPAPGTPRRPMWDLLHHNWGRATLLLAWANCFLGIVYFARGWGLLALTENQLLTALLVPAAVCLLLLGILDVVLSLVSRNRPVASTAVLAAEASKGSTGKEGAGGGPVSKVVSA